MHETNTYLAAFVQLSDCDVVCEGEVVRGVPVEAVGEHVERHRVDHLVDRRNHLKKERQGSSIEWSN